MLPLLQITGRAMPVALSGVRPSVHDSSREAIELAGNLALGDGAIPGGNAKVAAKLSNDNGWLTKTFSHIEVAPILRVESGRPVNPTLFNSRNLTQINPVFGSGFAPLPELGEPIAGNGVRQIQCSLDFEF